MADSPADGVSDSDRPPIYACPHCKEPVIDQGRTTRMCGRCTEHEQRGREVMTNYKLRVLVRELLRRQGDKFDWEGFEDVRELIEAPDRCPTLHPRPLPISSPGRRGSGGW